MDRPNTPRATNRMNDTPAAAPEVEIAPVDDPIRLFAAWFEEARKKEPNDAEAMALATVLRVDCRLSVDWSLSRSLSERANGDDPAE